MVREPNR